MKPEIYDFWAKKDLQIQKLVRVGRERHGIRTRPIYRAAKYIYNEKDGKYKDTWVNAWLVFSVAREMDYDEINALQRKEAANKQYLVTRIEKLEQKLNKKKLRYRIWNWFDAEHGLPHWE